MNVGPYYLDAQTSADLRAVTAARRAELAARRLARSTERRVTERRVAERRVNPFDAR